MLTRTLTHDERKAAEAAFRGLPCDPAWSTAARAVYDGIINAAQGKAVIAEPIEPGTTDSPQSAPLPQPSPEGETPLGIATREEAIKAGVLIDVTPLAREVGLELPVGLTKPLWDLGITAGHQIPEDEHQGRVRDVLVALRLFLERAVAATPLMEFPTLLTFPPETVPQVCSLYVLAHKDNSTPYSLTLLLPREVSAIKRLPLN